MYNICLNDKFGQANEWRALPVVGLTITFDSGCLWLTEPQLEQDLSLGKDLGTEDQIYLLLLMQISRILDAFLARNFPG